MCTCVYANKTGIIFLTFKVRAHHNGYALGDYVLPHVKISFNVIKFTRYCTLCLSKIFLEAFTIFKDIITPYFYILHSVFKEPFKFWPSASTTGILNGTVKEDTVASTGAML